MIILVTNISPQKEIEYDKESNNRNWIGIYY